MRHRSKLHTVAPAGCRSHVAQLAAIVSSCCILAGAPVAHAQTTVSTMAQLRSAVANPAVSAIIILPGTYLLTSSGSGELAIERNLTITNSGPGRAVIDANNASRVFSTNSATVTLTGLTITRGNGNGSSEGGAIFANSSTLRLVACTMSGNVTGSGKHGGGVWSNSSTLEVTNSTLSGNTATGAQGGAIYANGGSLLVSNTTVASNVAAAASGGGIYRNGIPLTLRNSIVADNTGGQINGSGTITGNGLNLVEGGCTGCPGGTLTADPALGALANNGGNSYTQALLAGSPALNTAVLAFALATDQRGVVRPQGAAPDIGAFELVPAGGAATVTPDGGQNLTRLPSNGTNYSFTFTLTNSGSGADGFDLLASHPNAAITIVSVNGAAGDSTRLASLAAGAAQTIAVVYSIGGVAAGSVDTLCLLGRPVIVPAASNAGVADLTVIRPSVTLSKTVTPAGSPPPGTELAYAITLTNAGSEDAAGLVSVDSVSTHLQFKVGSAASTLPAGVSATVAYSSNGGATWTYLPASGGCAAPAGFDGCVTRVRWTLLNALPDTAPNNTGELRFSARIR